MRETQRTLLINHFDKGGSLTVKSAMNMYGIYALSQRCGELLRDGYPIKKEWITFHNGKRVMRYSM